LEPEQAYEVFIDGDSIGDVTTNLGGKLMLSVSLELEKMVFVKIIKRA
jgi:hypothetical protein